MTQVELVYWWQQLFTKRKIVAAIISLLVKMLVAQTLTSGWGWGCRCEANTNVPGAPRILDPPLYVLVVCTPLLWTTDAVCKLTSHISHHESQHSLAGIFCKFHERRQEAEKIESLLNCFFLNQSRYWVYFILVLSRRIFVLDFVSKAVWLLWQLSDFLAWIQ